MLRPWQMDLKLSIWSTCCCEWEFSEVENSSQACSLWHMLELGFAMEPVDNPEVRQLRSFHWSHKWSFSHELTDIRKTWLFGHWILFKWRWDLPIDHFTTHIFKICMQNRKEETSRTNWIWYGNHRFPLALLQPEITLLLAIKICEWKKIYTWGHS